VAVSQPLTDLNDRLPTAAAIVQAADVLARCHDRDLWSVPDAQLLEVFAAIRTLRAATNRAEAGVLRTGRRGGHVLTHSDAGWSLWTDFRLRADHGGLPGDDVPAARDWASRLIAASGGTVRSWTVRPAALGNDEHHAIVAPRPDDPTVPAGGTGPASFDKETPS
jgi:hypothetical protein